MYFMARHTAIDCYEKRGKRGYLFIIGDEMAYSRVKAAEVEKVLGYHPSQPPRLREMVAEVRRKYDTYFIIPDGASYAGDARILQFWRDQLGQNVIALDDFEAVCETIALTIGLGEDAIDLDEGLDDLRDLGSTATGSVGKALARVGGDRGAAASAPPPPGLGDGSMVIRL